MSRGHDGSSTRKVTGISSRYVMFEKVGLNPTYGKQFHHSGGEGIFRMKKKPTLKAYKAFDSDWKCNGVQFRVGETYRHKGPLIICKSGFHACEKLIDCFSYYPLVQWTLIAEVEILGKLIRHDSDSKICADKIKIIREIEFHEIKEILKNQIINEINASNGVDESNGIWNSFGIQNSFGVSNSLFLASKKVTWNIFGKEVDKERFNEVKTKLFEKIGDWRPYFNNAFDIKKKEGWEYTDPGKIKEKSNKEAWERMPKEAIDYVKSLPEFDAEMFDEITGIK